MPLVRAETDTWLWFDDDAFVAFVKNEWDPNAAIEAQKSAVGYPKEPNPYSSEVEQQKKKMLEAYFGVMYLMKQNWHCDQISEKFKNRDQARKDCEKFSKYAEIIYEYLFQVYAKGAITAFAKPKFNTEIEELDICTFLRVLSSVSKYLFDEKEKKFYELKNDIKKKFKLTVIKELENEGELIDAIKNGQKEKSDEDLKNVRAKFNEKLVEFAKKAKEISDDEEMEEKELIVRRIWQGHPFLNEINDKAFIAFVENKWQTTADQEDKKRADQPSTSAAVDQHNQTMLEAYFGVMYLMQQNWDCDQISEKLKNDQSRKDCEKFSKYADIIYEYFYHVYALSYHLIHKREIVKPNFTLLDIRATLKKLSWISKIYFKEREKEKAINGKLKIVPKMENENSFNLGKFRYRDWTNFPNPREAFNQNLYEFAKKAKEMANDKEMAKKEKIFIEIWHGHPFFNELIDEDFIIFLNKLKTTADQANGLNDDQAKKLADQANASAVDQHNKKMLEAYFGVIFLMKENWNCKKITKQYKHRSFYDGKCCEKYKNYVHIIYEYFFEIYAKKEKIEKPTLNIRVALRKLSWISKIFFDKRKKPIDDLNKAMDVKFPLLPTLIKRNNLNKESIDNDLKALHDEFDKKLEEFAKNVIEMVANDTEMAEKEEIVKDIWQGHPFLKHSFLKKISSFLSL